MSQKTFMKKIRFNSRVNTKELKFDKPFFN